MQQQQRAAKEAEEDELAITAVAVPENVQKARVEQATKTLSNGITISTETGEVLDANFEQISAASMGQELSYYSLKVRGGIIEDCVDKQYEENPMNFTKKHV